MAGRKFKTPVDAPAVTVNDVNVVTTARTISTTAPVTGGGDLSADRTIAVSAASTTAAGVVQLSDATNSTSTTLAATANAVKTTKDAADAAQSTANAAVPKATTLTASDPLTIGGSSQSLDLSANRTIAVKAATAAGQTGVVALTDSTSSTSTTTAATPNSVKSAYDLAAAAIPKSTVTTTGDLIYASGNAAVTRLAAGTSGHVLTSGGASTAPSWAAVPGDYTWVVKGSDETVSSSTTFQDDDVLTFSLAANGIYAVEGIVLATFTSGASGGGFKSQITLPASASASGKYVTTTTVSQANAASTPVALQSGTTSVGTYNEWFTFIITNSSNSGSFTYQWAQSASFANNTTVKKGSYIRYRKIV